MPMNLEMIGEKIEIAPFVYDQDDVINGFDRPILHGLCACGFVIRAVLQKWSHVFKRHIDEVPKIFVETPMRAAEIIESVVHLSNCLSVKLSHFLRFVVVGNLLARCFSEEG